MKYYINIKYVVTKGMNLMIEEKLRLILNQIFKQYSQIEKVVLFGSRARQDNKFNSDIDICLFGEGITHLIHAKVSMDIDEINTCLSFDILNFNELNKKELIDNILKEGIVIYNG